MVAHYFFCNQKNNARQKQQHGYIAVMVQLKAMAQGQNAQHGCQPNHKIFETLVVHQVYTQQGQTGNKQRHHGTVYGTGQ